MLTIILLMIILYCALMAVISQRFLHATLWLAVVSALVALALYRLGAWEIAVIELSVGAGLVTVLMVFAITIVGESPPNRTSLSRRSLLIFVALVAALIVGLTLPILPEPSTTIDDSVAILLWQVRGLDVVALIALIFAGVMGVLGLLSVSQDAAQTHHEITSPQHH